MPVAESSLRRNALLGLHTLHYLTCLSVLLSCSCKLAAKHEQFGNLNGKKITFMTECDMPSVSFGEISKNKQQHQVATLWIAVLFYCSPMRNPLLQSLSGNKTSRSSDVTDPLILLLCLNICNIFYLWVFTQWLEVEGEAFFGSLLCTMEIERLEAYISV